MSFLPIFEKLENQQKTLGKLFWTNFVKNNFSENCLLILSESSENFRFCYVINYLFGGLLVQHREILSPQFLCADLPRSFRTSKPQA